MAYSGITRLPDGAFSLGAEAEEEYKDDHPNSKPLFRRGGMPHKELCERLWGLDIATGQHAVTAIELRDRLERRHRGELVTEDEVEEEEGNTDTTSGDVRQSDQDNT